MTDNELTLVNVIKKYDMSSLKSALMLACSSGITEMDVVFIYITLDLY